MSEEDQSETCRMVLSGASGMLGSAFSRALQQRGTRVLRLVRRTPPGPDELAWNPSAVTRSTHEQAIGIETMSRLEGLDAAVHLSGANVSTRRWSKNYKREMTESRVTTTRVLAEALARLKQPPKVLVTASAVGFYGDRGEQILDGLLGEGYCGCWD